MLRRGPRQFLEESNMPQIVTSFFFLFWPPRHDPRKKGCSLFCSVSCLRAPRVSCVYGPTSCHPHTFLQISLGPRVRPSSRIVPFCWPRSIPDLKGRPLCVPPAAGAFFLFASAVLFSLCRGRAQTSDQRQTHQEKVCWERHEHIRFFETLLFDGDVMSITREEGDQQTKFTRGAGRPRAHRDRSHCRRWRPRCAPCHCRPLTRPRA